jgi:hypothetical protein
LKIQLKSRLTIAQKYATKQLWIAFPHNHHWYLIDHDDLVERVRKHTNWLNSGSWLEKHGYSSTSINPALLESLKEDMIGPVYGHILEVG